MNGFRIGAGKGQPMGHAHGYYKNAGEKTAARMEKDVEKLLKTAGSLFEKMLDRVRELIEKQGGLASGKLTVHVEVRLELESDLGDGGYWSAEKTAERIMNFAKDLSGGDPGKIEALRDAVIKGFDEAKKVLGELPDISLKTYDLVMKGFDGWAAEFEK